MKLPIEVVVALLAGLSCLVAWPSLGIPVWALFIGWAWYFALGATPAVMKSIYLSMIPGSLLAVVCIALINFLSSYMVGMAAMILSVVITVYALMQLLKIPFFNCSLVGFNSFSTIFAVYYGGFYPHDGTQVDLLMALLWGVIGNALGPVFGYLSIRLSRS